VEGAGVRSAKGERKQHKTHAVAEDKCIPDDQGLMGSNAVSNSLPHSIIGDRSSINTVNLHNSRNTSSVR
jgi:hypothetical protein